LNELLSVNYLRGELDFHLRVALSVVAERDVIEDGSLEFHDLILEQRVVVFCRKQSLNDVLVLNDCLGEIICLVQLSGVFFPLLTFFNQCLYSGLLLLILLLVLGRKMR